VHCVRKTKITLYDNGKTKGSKQNYDFQDASGKIQSCAFNDLAKHFDRLIDVGKRYEISKAAVNKPYNGRTVTGYHNAELLMYKHTTVIYKFSCYVV